MAVTNKLKGRENVFYLNYDNIQPYIENGTINSYDEILTRDRGIKYFIDKDLNIIEVKARNYIFNSESDALTELNSKNSDYLAGQLIAIKTGNEYQAYTVNYDNTEEEYTIAKVCEGIIDYNRLDNIPIRNITADAADNLVLSELTDGYYNILGTYKISPNDETIRIVTSSIMYVIKHKGDDIYIRPFDSIDNEFYVVNSSGDKTVKEIATVDDVVEIVEDFVPEYVDDNSATTEDINNLFDRI